MSRDQTNFIPMNNGHCAICYHKYYFMVGGMDWEFWGKKKKKNFL